jgi:excinuclease ABC subunit C
VLALDGDERFDPLREADFFEALPSRPGVLWIGMKDADAQPYVARTADIRRAAERLLRPPDTPSKRLNLREVASRLRYRASGSKFEQTLTFYQHARTCLPERYRAILRLRPPAVLKVNLRNEYPRCYVTRSIRSDGAFYIGPFASRRIAKGFAEGFLDLFKIRRCQIRIRRDPDFPGCIYSEMKMCLAPCFAGCTKEEYDLELGRVVDALATGGESLRSELEREREAASAALDFERAAALHRRLEKASAEMRNLPEIARPIQNLNAVILQRAAEEKTIAVFPVLGGLLGEPVFLRFAELASEPRSVESILRGVLQSPSSPNPAESQPAVLRSVPPELPEHLSLIARWFYSKPRDGEIFFRAADWPYRRILRACSRLLEPPDRQPPAAPAGSGSDLPK